MGTTEPIETAEEREERAAWLKERRDGIGGSDVAAILGVSPWTDSFALWLDKTGQSEDEDNQTLARGRVIEPVLRLRYASEPLPWFDGKEPPEVREVGLQVGREPWMLGSPDALVGDDGGWEGKTSNDKGLWGEHGSVRTTRDNDVMPLYYAVQVAWYLEVKERDWWDVSCAFVPYEADRLIRAMLRQGIDRDIAGAAILDVSEVRHYRILRDPDFGARLVARVREWRQRHLVEGVPPDLTGSDAAFSWLQRYFPDALEPLRSPSDEELALVRDLREASAEVKAAKQREADLKALAMKAIGKAEGFRLPDGAGTVTWRKESGRRTIDGEALRIDHPAIAEKYTKRSPASRVLRQNWRKQR